MIRSVYSILAGLATACLLIFLALQLAHLLSPMPGNLDLAKKLALATSLQKAPFILYFVLLGGLALGSFAGGFVTWLISEHHHLLNAAIVGGVLTVAAVATLADLPQLNWFWVSALVFLPRAWLGARLPLSAQPPQTFA